MGHDHEQTVAIPVYALEWFERIIKSVSDKQLCELFCGIRDANEKLDCIGQKVDKIMSALDDANAALTTINDATNQLGTLAQTISAELTALLANVQPGQQITPELLAGFQGAASNIGALVPVLQGIASQGANNPVPVSPPTA